MYLITTEWRGRLHVDSMRLVHSKKAVFARFDELNVVDPNMFTIRLNVRVYELSATEPPNNVTRKLCKEWGKRK